MLIVKFLQSLSRFTTILLIENRDVLLKKIQLCLLNLGTYQKLFTQICCLTRL